MTEKLLPISTVAQMFGVRASTLRYYEDEGLLDVACRAGGKRWYSHEQLRRIALIQMYTVQGCMRLSQVKAIVDAETSRETFRSVLEEKIVELEKQIAQAQLAREVLVHHLTCQQRLPMQCPWLIDRLDEAIENASHP